jgi:hypothetical protein
MANPSPEGGEMKLSDVIRVWDILHHRNTGELGYCDLEKAIAETVGIEDDLPDGCIRSKPLPDEGGER